jgi:uncharacterized protein (DUF1015 family)
LILPTHRVILKSKIKPVDVADRLASEFDVLSIPADDEARRRVSNLLSTAERPTLAVYLGKKLGWLALTAKNVPFLTNEVKERSSVWRILDVSYAQHLVVGAAFGVPEKHWMDHVRYTQDLDEAVKAVDAKKGVAVVVGRPVTTKQLRSVADAREVMPQKSTFFVPKLLSGAMFNKIGKEPAGPLRRGPTS